ncbi:MAG: biotin/lipoyl-containing protein [Chitinophagaceae bacterium]
MKYTVKANDFEFAYTDESIQQVDIEKISLAHYHVLANHRSVKAAVTAADLKNKKIIVELEGSSYEVIIKDELDAILDTMGFGLSTERQIKEIKAPMPGLVLEIVVKQGDAVEAGHKLLVLEAMKMENSIMLPANAIIKRIAVVAGQAVEKGQLLIELE